MENEEQKESTQSTPETIDGTVVETTETPAAEAVAEAPAQKPKFKNMKGLLGGLVGALVLAAIVFFGFVHIQVKKLSTSPFILKTAAALHIPAVKAEGATLSYVDYMGDLQALKKLSNNPSFTLGAASEKDLSDLVIANFLTNLKTKQIAAQYNLSVAQSEIDQKKSELISQFGEDQVKKSIQESYGWDVDTFIKKIIEPSILNAKVKEAFEKNADLKNVTITRQEANVSHILVKVTNFQDPKEVKEKKKKIEMIAARLKRGEDFAKLAKQYSDDPSKDQGGNLGWVPRGGTVPAFDQVAFTIEPKKISGIIETSFGFHILKVDERRTVADFDGYIDSEVKKMTPQFYIPIHNPLETTTTPSAAPVPAAPAAAPAPTGKK